MSVPTLANPVGVWWWFLIAVSSFNVAVWVALYARQRARAAAWPARLFAIEPLVLLSAGYVFGCAFRSVLPRADVQRICLFDTWLSSVLVGRSVATVAELCFAVQWAIVLNELGRLGNSDTARNVAKAVVPLIALAECCSWYAVITTSSLGNALENSLWTVTFLLIGGALVRLVPRFRGPAQYAIAATVLGIAGYIGFMTTVDVPMYLGRWESEIAAGHQLLGFASGFHDLATDWIVTDSLASWRHEIPWMSLYFSVAVWTSLAFGALSLVRHRLPQYRAEPSRPKMQQASLVFRH